MFLVLWPPVNYVTTPPDDGRPAWAPGGFGLYTNVNYPGGVVVNASGYIIAIVDKRVIRTMSPSGVVSTIAGNYIEVGADGQMGWAHVLVSIFRRDWH